MRHMRSRRILAMLLALSMIFGLLTTTAFAGEVNQNPSNVEESAANSTSAGGSGEGQPSGASEDESSTETNKEDVLPEEETTPEEKKTTSSEEVDTQVGEEPTPVETQLTDYVVVGGIKGFEGQKFATFEAAYEAIKPTVETLGLGEESPANAAAFDAVFTDVQDGIATLTYTIAGNITYNETNLDHLLTMGRKSSHYLTNERHLINFKFVGADANRGATLTVNSNITLPYEWWGENTTTSISFKNLTITGSAPNGLYPYQACFDGIDFTVDNCTLKGIKIYNCANVGGSYTITNSTLDGTGAATDAYAIHLQGHETAPLNITISGNEISGYDRGINIDQKTAVATISNNEISVNDKGRSCIQLSGLAETTISGNTLALNGGNAFTLHKNLRALTAAPEISISGNTITGTGYLIYDDAAANNNAFTADTLNLNYGPNTVDGTVDTTKGVKDSTVVEAGSAVQDAIKGTTSNAVTTSEELAGAIANASDGDTIKLAAGEFTTYGNLSPKKSLIFVGSGEGTVWTIGDLTKDVHGEGNGDFSFDGCDTITFKNMTLKSDGADYRGFIRISNTIVDDCVLSGKTAYWGYETAKFINSKFNAPEDDYALWDYSSKSMSFDGCEFNISGKGVNVYVEAGNAGSDARKVEVKDCTVTSTKENKAFLNIKNSTQAYDVTISGNNTVNGLVADSTTGSNLYQVEATEITEASGKPLTVKQVDAEGKATIVYQVKKQTDVAKGSETNPYSLEELGAMTRDAYIAAQKELGGTMYVTVGDYSYPDHGVLGNGKRDDTTGQTEDRSVLNGYNSNGYLDDKNDGANGKSIVFVNGSITSGVTGYETIDGITKITSLLLAVPAYTNVTFKGITFTNVMCFDYQLYTGPWSQLGELKFDGCTFNGIIIGSIAAQTLTFNSCTFENFENTTKANNSNPTWIRPAYGNWTPSDNEGQGSDFRSLTKINFTNNKVTSTRPVKFERISQWDKTATIKVDGNTFNMTDDGSHKNVGMYLGAFSDETEFNLKLGTNSKGNTTAAIFALPKGKTSLPVGSTVTDLNDNPTSTDDAVTWHTETKITLKTEPVSTETSIDLATFLAWAEANNYDVDGSNYEGVAAGEKLVVKWSPVTGSYYTNGGTHTCDAVNIPATANTPQRVNNGLTQFQILSGSDKTVTVKNVKFVYTPAAFKLCTNAVASEGQYHGSFEADDAPAGQLYFMTTGDVTFESCDFEKVVLTTFNTTGTSTVTNCNFANVYNNYAIKDIRGANVSVTGTTITNCGGGIMVSSTGTVDNVTLTNNTFTKVDVAGTAPTEPENKVGTRAILQFADSGDYAKAALNFSGNTATNCGPVVRQLNKSAASGVKAKEEDLKTMQSEGQNLYTSDSKDAVPAGYVTDENGNVTISTAEGLFWFAKQANAGNNFAGKTVTLANDIDLNNEPWTPIGVYNDSKTHFKGTFDGQNHTVRGLNVVASRINGVGFFGKVYTGTIKNLTVEGSVTTGNCNYVGGIVGHGYATITNCTFKGTVGDTTTMQVGGIAGSGGFTVTNCSVYGDVIAQCWAGGIVGNCQDGGAYTNCYVDGIISAEETYWGGGAAGITPVPLYPSQVISGCYSDTVVKVAGKEVNCPIIASYNNPLDYDGYTGDLKIYDNSWNKEKNSNDSYPIYAEKNGVGGVLVEGKTVSRDNNLIMFEAELQSVTDLNKVRIMPQSSVTQEQVDALAVAAVGESKYTSLAAAIAAAEDGNTVTLLKDATEDVEITKNITLDLGGKTLTNTGAGKATITNNGTVTITDKSTAKTGTIKRDDNGTVGETSYYVIHNLGTMTIEQAIVTNNSGYKKTNPSGSMVGSSLICNGGDVGATLTINGGTFTQMNFLVVKNDALGTLNVTGGTFTSSHSAIQNWFKANITGGEINGQLWTDSWAVGESVGETTIGGNAKVKGEIVMDITGSIKPTLEISSGNFDVTWRITNAAANAGAKPAVSGGKFTSAVPENYCADGYVPTENEDGTYGVKVDDSVAEVGGVKYLSLQKAIDAAGRKQTVKLLKDTTENVTMGTPYLTLDLNGHTLNGSTGERKPALTVTARVTVMDSSADQTGKIMREDTAENSGVSSHYVIDVQGDGWLTFESGNVINNSGTKEGKGASLVRVGDDSVAKHPGLNIKGGNFKQDNFIAIKVDRGTFYLNGGTITSENSYAIENWWYATIKGGTVSGTVSSWVYSGGKAFSELEISGGTIDGDVASVSYDNAVGKTAKVTISGGTVTGTLGTYTYSNGLVPLDDPAKATIGVTGGTFTKNPTKYVVEDSTVKVNDDGTFGVEKAYLAKVGDTSYYTMEEAFKAQTASGEAIVLLRDYTTGSSFSSGSINRTVDLNNHTWTYTGTDTNSAAFEVNHPNATLTVKNGTVDSGSMIGLIPSAMGGTMTYDNSGLVFEKVEATAKGNSGIETNGNNTNDTVTLKNSTLNVPNGFGIYFPSSGKLTIDNSKITANTLGVQVCSGSLDISGAETKIEVTGNPVPKTENDGAIQDGAAISIVNRTGYKGLEKITVTEGTFKAKKGNDAVKAYNWVNKEAGEATFTASDKVAISGGSYSTVVPADLCAEGFVPVTKANADGLFEVTKDTNEAKIGNTKYATLADALKVATSGDTIVLLNDVTHATGFVLNDGILIDLNGHNLTTPFIFTSIEGGAGIIDSSNNANGGSGTLKLMFKKTTLNGISRTAKNSAGTADISGYFFPVFTGETTNEGTTWYNYKIYWGYVYSWPNSGTSTVDSIKFSFSVIFRNREAYQYFVNDPEQINVWFDVLLGNTENGQQSNMSFKFTTDHIKTTWAQATINANGGVVKFNLTFKGLSEYAGATVYGTPYAQSNYTNASMNGSQLTATVQEQG